MFDPSKGLPGWSEYDSDGTVVEVQYRTLPAQDREFNSLESVCAALRRQEPYLGRAQIATNRDTRHYRKAPSRLVVLVHSAS